MLSKPEVGEDVGDGRIRRIATSSRNVWAWRAGKPRQRSKAEKITNVSSSPRSHRASDNFSRPQCQKRGATIMAKSWPARTVCEVSLQPAAVATFAPKHGKATTTEDGSGEMWPEIRHNVYTTREEAHPSKEGRGEAKRTAALAAMRGLGPAGKSHKTPCMHPDATHTSRSKQAHEAKNATTAASDRKKASGRRRAGREKTESHRDASSLRHFRSAKRSCAVRYLLLARTWRHVCAMRHDDPSR